MSLAFGTGSNRKAFARLKDGLRWGTIKITLDNAYATGGWAITAANLNIRNLHLLIPPAFKSGYGFEWDDANAKLKAYRPADRTEGGLTMPTGDIWAIDGDGANTNGGGIVGDVTLTEAAAAYCKVYDDSAAAGSKYCDFNVSASAGAGITYAANYQFFPDTELENDAVYFGNAVPFCELSFDMSATVAVYGAASCAWEYWDGAAWSALTIVLDNTGTTATDGQYSFERDGTITFIPPADWASVAVGNTGATQTAYWVRCRIKAGFNVTTIPISNAKEHQVVTPTDGYIVAQGMTIGSFQVIDQTTGTLHTNAVKFILMNFTTGAHSGELTWAASQRQDYFTIAGGLACADGDELGVLVTSEDGTNEVINGQLVFDIEYPAMMEASVADAGLTGLVLKCLYIGS